MHHAGSCVVHASDGSGNIHCIYISALGKKTAMKFDVEKIFQETRRTAREYSQQASGRRKYISSPSPSCLLAPQAESLTSTPAVEVFMLYNKGQSQ